MNDDISKGVWLVANIFIGKIITSLASKLRKPELYAAIDYPLKPLNNSLKNNTTILYVINKGKDKENNIEVHLPKNKFIKILSKSNVNAEVVDDKIKIKRLLSKEDITMTISYFGDILAKDNLPYIFSDNATGKSYIDKKHLPIGRGPTFFLVTTLLISGVAISSLFVFKIDPFDYVFDKYNHYKYENFYKSGFNLSNYQIAEKLKNYDINNNELPVMITDFNATQKQITFKLKVTNKIYPNAKTYASFDLRNFKQFQKKKDKIEEDYSNDKNYATYSKKYDDLIAEFRYPTNGSSEKVNIKMNESKFLTLTRNIPKGLISDDLNLNVFLISDNDDLTLFSFNFGASGLKSPNLSISKKTESEGEKNNHI
ncbi:hypothetical protein RZ761_21125 [Klebsiella pasteurii]|uniref:Uncharacterized protein n=1 Tax=Klebsiella pasteurii TaxID=2587529 RepID=A0ABT5CVB1_9ENTR|nr:hypothetical protein [Klebsiella pasteurii]MDC0695512.1 hypothetical protein [Klebsiella pasteurii]MDC0756230.1 hypothetical protein [Klebsiella pasteurii]MDQ2170439.1 hypothetical protein [Klebsiella pasteurii]MDQ2202872.1 hypothetical protein [Klebsiella pasteurii]MDQ2226580.1 hypothetical protein [Klebsiella pasteurii]